VRPAGQPDVIKLIVAFQNFANVPKNYTVVCLTQEM